MPRRTRVKDLYGVISSKDAEMLLTDLANFNPSDTFAPPDHVEPIVKRFFLRWGKAFPGYDLTGRKDACDFFMLLVGLTAALQKAWSARTFREREWHAINARRIYNSERVKRSELGLDLDRLISEEETRKGEREWEQAIHDAIKEYKEADQALPPLTVLDVSVQHFQQILQQGHANVCQNPHCGAPYFLTTKPGQKFCSDPCSLPAKREAKLRWWRRSGRQQRKEKKLQQANKDSKTTKTQEKEKLK